MRNIAKFSPKMAKKKSFFDFFDFFTNCSYDSNESESEGKKLKPTPLPHMRLWFTKLPLLYELYGESHFSLFASIFPLPNKETFQSYYTCDKQVLWECAGAFFPRDNSLVSARKSHSSGVRGLAVRFLLFNPEGSCSNP